MVKINGLFLALTFQTLYMLIFSVLCKQNEEPSGLFGRALDWGIEGLLVRDSCCFLQPLHLSAA